MTYPLLIKYEKMMRVEIPPARAWHTLSLSGIFRVLASDARGLHQEEAVRRLHEHGPNELAVTEGVSPWRILFEQFQNVLVLILLVATVISAVLGHSVEAIAIAVIVLFAVLLGFVQEYRAERAIEALRKLASPSATVLRDGVEREIAARELVPGDVLFLRTGDRIPADCRLMEAVNFHADEAALTGESIPVAKSTEVLEGRDIPIGDRRNMAYAGTVSTCGRACAVVTGTGMRTEFGRIAGMLQTVRKMTTPLQQNLDRVGKILAKAAFVIVFIVVLIEFFRGQQVLEMFIFGVALAVAVVPEALPAVVTISLAFGVRRMVKRHALMRHLPAVETLGSTSVICSDKTGTLTKNEMTARKVYVAGDLLEVSGTGYTPSGSFSKGGMPFEITGLLVDLLTAAALASDTTLVKREGHFEIKGDPTEGALVVAAAKAGLHKGVLDSEFPRVAEIPFASETKRMTTIHATPHGPIAYSKGAPEVILATCALKLTRDSEARMSEEDREAVLNVAHWMGSRALRVLAVARKRDCAIETAERGMTFLGLIGMIDPPRPEAIVAVQKCKQAGIRLIMITGDHPVTAEAVARELGLVTGGVIVTGSELDSMNEATFDHQVERIGVYARVSPVHKLRIVEALQKKGHIVAMTGDGVNDAPALKKANIGIAMGITGTDVTKEASDMMLMDDNFASIVAAVEEGRIIFGNIKKYLMYLLSSNIGEIGLVLLSSLFGLPLPLSAVQILYVNLATDGLPALALAVDPPERDLMHRPPRNPKVGIFTRSVIALMFVGGLWSTAVNLSLFTWALRSGRTIEESMTITFASLVFIQFFKAYNFRSDRLSVFHRPFENKWLNLSILWGLTLMGFIVYIPPLHAPFGTYSLPLRDLVVIVGAAASIVPVIEVAKVAVRRWKLSFLRS
jgi:Ca2+-transporting ATPase